ncbi:protein CHLOROPLAST IMPORT APPARATUS 2-like [Curcuma longa]|uniref:protein CHLOROPLAST IMPORT APPARATUS 2-like n=1 Tax=Curcuma longa TaxID=136217 RepID=UPI003D9DE854
MTPCLRSGSGGGGRSCGFDIVKSSSTSWSRSLESSSSSSPSSAISESSNSPSLAISIKRARTPRKRPNQTYNEATAILSATYPVVFSACKTARPSVSIPTNPFHPFPEPPDLLPLPILNDAAFLIPNPNPPYPAAATHFHLKSKTYATVSKESAESPASEVSWEPNSPAHPIGEDFDAESILEAEVKQGIDSIIGTLAFNTPITDAVDSLLRGFVERRIPSSFEPDFGSQWALRKRDEDEWWSSKVVPVSDITPNYKPSSPATVASQKKNKKAEKKEIVIMASEQGKWKPALGLKLNHEEVLRHWTDRGSVFSDRPGSSNSLVDATAYGICLPPDPAVGSDAGEVSVQRCKEKRGSHVFSKTQRRKPTRTKANLDKGPSLLNKTPEAKG